MTIIENLIAIHGDLAQFQQKILQDEELELKSWSLNELIKEIGIDTYDALPMEERIRLAEVILNGVPSRFKLPIEGELECQDLIEFDGSKNYINKKDKKNWTEEEHNQYQEYVTGLNLANENFNHMLKCEECRQKAQEKGNISIFDGPFCNS